MIPHPPIVTRTYPRFPYPTLFRSILFWPRQHYHDRIEIFFASGRYPAFAIADIGSEEILTDRLVIGDRRVTVELGGDRRLARVTVHRDNIWLDRFQRRQGCNGHNASSRQGASNASAEPRQLFGALGRRDRKSTRTNSRP